ncbi:MAG: NADH-quinone oxidoreductase subunit C [Actinomycetota bacterium]
MAGLPADDALRRVDTAVGNRLMEQRVNFGQVDITVSPENLIEVITALRDLQFLSCNFFTFLTGIDRSEFTDDPGGLEVLIHVYSVEHVFHVNVHVKVDLENPVCPSIVSIFRGAEWQERECHEMFGVEFEGNSNLSNLFLPEDFEGHPLLRSFKLPSRFVKAWPGAKDPEEASAGGR